MDQLRARMKSFDDFVSVRDARDSAYWAGHITERIESWAASGRRKGLQYVYPLLDRRAIEFSLSFPGKFFVNHGEGRFVFRKAVEDFWPPGMAFSVRKAEPALQNLLSSMRKGEDVFQGLLEAALEL
jgi:hypothetical protein